MVVRSTPAAKVGIRPGLLAHLEDSFILVPLDTQGGGPQDRQRLDTEPAQDMEDEIFVHLSEPGVSGAGEELHDLQQLRPFPVVGGLAVVLLNRLHRPPDAIAWICNLNLAERRVVVGMDRDGQLLGARRSLDPVPVVHTAFGELDIIGQDQHIAADHLVEEAHVGQEVRLVRGQDHRSPLLNTHSNASASG